MRGSCPISTDVEHYEFSLTEKRVPQKNTIENGDFQSQFLFPGVQFQVSHCFCWALY